MKQSMKRSSHRDVVDEATALLNPDEADDNATIDPTLLKLDTTLPVLRNRCIGWMVDAFHTCNNKELILKAYELCSVGPFNCSHASLTSSSGAASTKSGGAVSMDHNVGAIAGTVLGAREEIVNEDLFAENEEDLTYNDESDVLIEVLINHVTSGGVAPLPDGFVVGEDGDLARNGAAEDPEVDVVADDLPLAVRRPKRATKAPTQYGGDEMWEEH
ncbi:hypothetical protein B0H10DRAFT_1957087 [Mycena sp. CBHHK59/15]|nr:hypothetical protein B0H10DRAFT_1957087 [Mycena sp. CBHHK59/15]